MIVMLLLAIFFLLGILSVGKIVDHARKDEIWNQKKEIKKWHSYFKLLNHWMESKQRKIPLINYFKLQGFRTVAIYGMGELGQRLYEEIKNTDITVSCVIDKNVGKVYAEVPVLNIGEELPQTDAIIVTVISSYSEIATELAIYRSQVVLSLEEVIYGLNDHLRT